MTKDEKVSQKKVEMCTCALFLHRRDGYIDGQREINFLSFIQPYRETDRNQA